MQSLSRIVNRCIRLPPTLICKNQPVYNFSKKLKHKLKQNLEQKQKSQQIIKKTGSLDQWLSHKTIAQKANIEYVLQIGPASILLFNCLVSSQNCLQSFFQYSLIGVDKFTSLLVITNLLYPQENKNIKYAMIGSIFLTSLIPTFSNYSYICQLIQLVFVIANDNKKIPERYASEITPEIAKLMETRMKMKLSLYLFLIAILAFKIYHFYQIYQFKRKIQNFNLMNLQLQHKTQQLNKMDKNKTQLQKQNLKFQLNKLNEDILK